MSITERNTSHRTNDRSRAAKASLLATMPIVLASSLAMSMNVAGPLTPAEHSPDRTGDEASQLRENVRSAFADARAATAASALPQIPAADYALAATPASYTVQAGDSVSGIAARFGLSTAHVLALNGLGWKTVIHPGQVLVLTHGGSAVATPAPAPKASASGSYTVAAGDTISGIASRHGVSVKSVLTANGLSEASIIYPGQRLVISGGASAPASVTVGVPQNTSARYTIMPGDSVTSIAKQHGVSTGALLAANGLSLSSTIFAGKTLTIPSVQPAGTVPATPSSIVPMTSEMARNARTIVAVGRSLGVPEYGLVVALATAAQESTLRNLSWGDLDSVGLFQQRPSAGWGTVAQLTTPEHAARLFYGGRHNPNPGVTRGLLDIPGWQSLSLTEAAQAVQISAYPDAYAKWEASARSWLAQIG